MALPLVSIVWIALRQLSKPLARYLASQAPHYRTFRVYLVVPLGQFYHRCETRARMLNQGFKWPRKIPPLQEEKAIEYSTEMLSELLIFLVAISPIVYTWYQVSSSHKEKSEVEQLKGEANIEYLSNQLMNLTIEIDKQAAELRNFERRLGDIDTRHHKLISHLEKAWYKFW